MSISIPINFAEEKWKTIEGLESQIEQSVKKACAYCQEGRGQNKGQDKDRDMEVSVLLASDAECRELNKKFRGKDRPTNVLSFPAICKNGGSGPILLGDIILSYETVLRESSESNKSHLDHITHLVVHGVLHLFGYTHDEEEAAREMEDIEVSILKEFGIDNPYMV